MNFILTTIIHEDGMLEANFLKNNVTETDLYNNTSVIENSTSSDGFSETLATAIQAVMAFSGFIGNVIAFITLKESSSMFANTALRLLKNQAVADAIVCFLGSIFVLQPPMWTTGLNENLDLLICQVRKP